MKLFIITLNLCWLFQSYAHEHGHAKINGIYENSVILLELNMPLEQLVGFEHAPKKDTKKQELIIKAMAKLDQGLEEIFLFTEPHHTIPCKGKTLEKTISKNHHPDLLWQVQFKCQKKPVNLSVNLSRFYRVEKITIELLANGKAHKRSHSSAMASLSWPHD